MLNQRWATIKRPFYQHYEKFFFTIFSTLKIRSQIFLIFKFLTSHQRYFNIDSQRSNNTALRLKCWLGLLNGFLMVTNQNWIALKYFKLGNLGGIVAAISHVLFIFEVFQILLAIKNNSNSTRSLFSVSNLIGSIENCLILI